MSRTKESIDQCIRENATINIDETASGKKQCNNGLKLNPKHVISQTPKSHEPLTKCTGKQDDYSPFQETKRRKVGLPLTAARM
jgi:hypothetical protein